MKTLVIHPKDSSTDFLSEIYDNKDWTVIKHNASKKVIKDAIKSHDRIVMLGHGTEKGLIGFQAYENGNFRYRFIIDSSLVYLLREKLCVCIWCNADEFVKKYNLKGFFTGMFISEYEEALMFCVYCTSKQIKESNELFAKVVKESIDSEDMFVSIKTQYLPTNEVQRFNHYKLYHKD